MKTTTLLFAAAMSVSGLALAQTTVNQITDPAKIAEIEQHAKQLAAGGQSQSQSEAMPAMGDHEHMGQHKKMHHRAKSKAKAKAKDKAAPDTPMGKSVV